MSVRLEEENVIGYIREYQSIHRNRIPSLLDIASAFNVSRENMQDFLEIMTGRDALREAYDQRQNNTDEDSRLHFYIKDDEQHLVAMGILGKLREPKKDLVDVALEFNLITWRDALVFRSGRRTTHGRIRR